VLVNLVFCTAVLPLVPIKPLTMLIHGFSLLLLIFQLSACGYIPIESEVPDQLPSFRAQVTPGETSQQEVHGRLGKPFISDKRLGIELYRVASGRDADVHVAPFPLWVDTEEVIIYAMIIYDRDDVVEAMTWDVFQRVRDTDYGFDDLPELYQGTEFRIAKLEAYGYLFIAVKEGKGKSRKEFLLAPASKSREALTQTPPENGCALLFFYPQMAHLFKYYLDGDLVGTMPLVGFYEWIWDPDLQLVFTKLIVDEGRHELKLKSSRMPREIRRKFDCKPGQVFYAHPKLDLVESEPWGLLRKKTKYEGDIRIDHQPLEDYGGWKRLLYYNGNWFGVD
jgi:hypothetical protein